MRDLLVTGCYRSGTTLLEKLLHQNGQISVASQPIPVFFFYAKEKFLESRGLVRRYPLDHMFLETEYSRADFDDFLQRLQLTDVDIDAIFKRLSQYREGHWTPEILRCRPGIRSGCFLEVWHQLNECIAELLAVPDAQVSGGKEILVEEYVPFLLSKGGAAVLIIRDPRDVIASLSFGDRENATGLPRPVLYSVRIWRKSVAYALALEEVPGFAWVRYEDLVADPAGVLNSIADKLGVQPFDKERFANGIVDQRGKMWSGNSSFESLDRVSSAQRGRHKSRLPRDVAAFIEVCAAPEMKTLGYTSNFCDEFDERALYSYKDPFSEMHAKFERDYSSNRSRLDKEVERYNKLMEGDGTHSEPWFVLNSAFNRLVSASDGRNV